MTPALLKKIFWILLLPLSVLWAGLMKARRRYSFSKDKFQFKTPILCVGNLHSGGSGKTPILIELAKKLGAREKITILSRGYGSKSTNVGAWLDLNHADGETQFGDEPWMMAHLLPVPIYIDKKRERAIPIIEAKTSPSLILMDDGFQYLRLKKTIQIVLISTQKKVEESFCLPLGELREPLSAIHEADAVVLTTTDKDGSATRKWRKYLREAGFSLPIFSAERRVEGIFQGQKLIPTPPPGSFGIFSGIASPVGFEKDVDFFIGKPALHVAFSDHFKYQPATLERFVRSSQRRALQYWLTTDKDWYKVKDLWNLEIPLYSLRIGYQMESQFWDFLNSRMP